MISELAEAIHNQIDSINEVSRGLSDISEMSQNISAATEEQTTNAKHVSLAVEDNNKVVQETALSAEVVSDAAGKLVGMSEQLSDLVAEFKVLSADEDEDAPDQDLIAGEYTSKDSPDESDDVSDAGTITPLA